MHVSSLSTNEHVKKNFACAFGVAKAIHLFFKRFHSKFMIFRAKIGILEKYLHVFHTLFILYLEGNHTLFGEKIYFIWKFSSGNTVFLLRVKFRSVVQSLATCCLSFICITIQNFE